MASFRFRKVYLGDSSTISSNNEKINTKHSIDDYFDGEKTIELAEVKMQKKVIKDLEKDNKIDVILGSDLSNQLGITNEALSNFNTSFLGLYNACASYVEELIVASSILGSSSLKKIACVVSSNNLNAEKIFRYPIEYGSPRRITQSFTATGAVASIVTKAETNIKLESCTIGSVVDFGIKDVNNMGAIMAPAACNTLIEHLKDMKRDISYYDLVLTGDLGKMGSELFTDLLAQNDITIKKYIDAGSILITDTNLTDQGASGPVCLPLVLIEKVLKEKKNKKILIIGTGSLHNTSISNQHKSIPAIAHAISLEVLK